MAKCNLKIINYEKVPPKMTVTSNEWKHKNSATIWKSPKWIDFKDEQQTEKEQHEKSLTSKSAAWKSCNRETTWKKSHMKKAHHEMSESVKKVWKERCKLLKMQHEKRATQKSGIWK